MKLGAKCFDTHTHTHEVLIIMFSDVGTVGSWSAGTIMLSVCGHGNDDR